MENKKKTYKALSVLVLMVLTHSFSFACTAFMSSDGNKVLVGNNEDYNIPYTRMWFVPGKNGQYGIVYFGYDNWSPQGGMNDQGLFFDFFATKPLEVELSKEKPKFQGPLIEKMAAECATVEEVLDLFGRYNLEFMLKFQMFVVDKTGDAAIIEGDIIIRKSGSNQVVTNFYQSKVEENRRPCEWHKPSCSQYKMAETMLSEYGTASVTHFRDILEATHRNTLGARTLYSNIYDLKNGLVYLYYLHNFDNEVIIDLNEELKKGSHYYEIRSLFGKKATYGKKEYVHNSPAFRISYPKHYKLLKPESDEVFRAKIPYGGAPILSVSIVDKPQDIPLKNIGEKLYLSELKKSGTDVNVISNIQSKLNDGTSANEVQFSWVTKDKWPVKTLVLLTYREDKLIFAAVHSLAHPSSLREFLYSLRFD